MTQSWKLKAAVYALLCARCNDAFAFDVTFTDVASPLGLGHVGPSFGASWGDFDRDGNPDLFLANHWSPTAIYHNNGTGFADVSATAGGSLTGDLHAGAWGDFDNDGDQDLAISVGAAFGSGAENNRVLERTPTGFSDVAAALGLQLGAGRGRTPLWLDWNGDGALDMLFANLPRNDGMAPTTLFTQTPAGFVDANASVGMMPEGNTHYATLFSDGPSAQARLLIQNLFPFPGALYDYSSAPFSDVQGTLGLAGIPAPIYDLASGDFDNDLQTELYLTRVADPMIVRAITSRQARAFLRGAVDTNHGMSFSTPGLITVTVGPDWEIATTDVKIGSAGLEPPGLSFSLDPTDAGNWGAFNGDPSTPGLFVHFDTVAQLWSIELRDAAVIGVVVDAISDIENLQGIDIPDEPATREHVYLDRAGPVFVNATAAAGLAAQRACPASASADFDNDMDLDIYLVCSDTVGNLPNVLLENNGAGVFTSVPGAAGAIGAVGGRGEAVALADFDSDGFVDILVTNGNGAPPLPNDGPTQLYRNGGNSNHWLEIQLRGVQSNADGVGATVVVEAGGVTQYRLQNSGMHRYAQDHARLHFGLGGHEVVDRITVHWPSGIVQVLENESPDNVLDIVEAQTPDTDGDSVLDDSDNCQLVPNADQRDTNGDGFGNVCDTDLSDDCTTNVVDLGLLKFRFFDTGPGLDADLDGDDIVNAVDLGIMKAAFFAAPGPSGLADCEP